MAKRRRPTYTYRNRGRVRTFKSKFEKRIHDELKEQGIDSNYEAEKIEYVTSHKYSPDFPVTKKDGTPMYLEAKGVFDAEDRSKHIAIRKQHPDLDIRFIFYADQKLNKRAKMRYSGWCEKWGYKYCIQKIPDEWLEELEINVKTKRK